VLDGSDETVLADHLGTIRDVVGSDRGLLEHQGVVQLRSSARGSRGQTGLWRMPDEKSQAALAVLILKTAAKGK